MRGVGIKSSRDIDLQAGVGRDVTVSSGQFLVSTSGSTSITSRSISLGVQWNEDIQMTPKGGAVQASALRLTGGRVVSHDALEGLSVRSMEDVTLSAGKDKDIMMSAGAVLVASAKSTKIRSRTIELETGWNQALTMNPNGGLVSMGAVQMTGSRVGTDDEMHGMSIRSKEDVEIAAAEDSDVYVSGGSIALAATESVSMVGSSVSLTSEWGGAIELSAVGGSTVVDSLSCLVLQCHLWIGLVV